MSVSVCSRIAVAVVGLSRRRKRRNEEPILLHPRRNNLCCKGVASGTLLAASDIRGVMDGPDDARFDSLHGAKLQNLMSLSRFPLFPLSSQRRFPLSRGSGCVNPGANSTRETTDGAGCDALRG